jgi:DNA repair protein RecO (recombination protein O)
MITKTEAVVLKSMNFRDSSKIVTFYTRRYGKVKGIAKGARQMKSKFGASLQPITKVSLVLYKKEHRDLQLISECDAIKTYKSTHSELERMAVALSILELVNQLSHEEEDNDKLYLLLVETLNEIENAKKNFLNLLFAFEIRYAAQFGFTPNLEVCSICGRKVDDMISEGTAVFRLSRGAILCNRCAASEGQIRSDTLLTKKTTARNGGTATSAEGSVRISIGTLKTLQRLLTARLDSIASLELNTASGNEIDGTLRLYMRQHFEDLKPLRSLDILKKFSIAGS